MSEHSISRRSFVGPLLLILIGVALLLVNLGYIRFLDFGRFFARYWPVLLILAGGLRLLEYFYDRASGRPARTGIGFGGVVLLLLLIIAGVTATTLSRVNWGSIRSELDLDDSFGSLFANRYTFDSTLEDAFPSGAALNITSGRGSITVHPWESQRLRVVVHKTVAANDEGEAKRIDQGTQPSIAAAGSMVTVRANNSASGFGMAQTNMEIFAPAKAAIEVHTQRGDVLVHDRTGNVQISTSRGDVTGKSINGGMVIEMRRGSVNLQNISGDVDITGRVDNATIADVGGRAELNGDFFGDTSLSKVAGAIAFKSPRSEVEMARLDGDLQMESDHLRASNLNGPVRIKTRSKDIHLSGVNGNVRVENANGSVSLQPTQMGEIDIINRRGEVELVLPARAGFQMEAVTQRGNIQSDFEGIQITSDDDRSRAAGAVNGGGPRVQIDMRDGDVHIRKGASLPGPAPGTPPHPPRAVPAKPTGASIAFSPGQ
jgi:DUF4097 and DUF4098 domain-containing protein YvlB